MDSRLDAILQAHVARGHDTADRLLGAAFAVVGRDGRLAYHGAAGRIGFDPDTSPRFGADSFTWVASLTKLVTATCLMQLVERGAVGLDDDVRGLVPELGRLPILRGFDADDRPVLDDNVRPIGLRMLLIHTLGAAYDLTDPDLVKWCQKVRRRPDNLDCSVRGLSTPLSFAPGDGWCYGKALDWAGLVLERVTGQSLGQYMQAHVFDPLAMADTGFWPERLPQTASRTVAWARRDAATSCLRPARRPTPERPDAESGGAGLYTTARDYARFLGALLGGRLVGEATLGAMFTPQLDDRQNGMLEAMAYHVGLQHCFAPEFPPGLAIDHGIGGVINMEDVPGKRPKGSLMWSGMCNSHWWMDRETGIAAVLIVNVVDPGDGVVVRLYDELERAVYAHVAADGGRAAGVRL